MADDGVKIETASAILDFGETNRSSDLQTSSGRQSRWAANFTTTVTSSSTATYTYICIWTTATTATTVDESLCLPIFTVPLLSTDSYVIRRRRYTVAAPDPQLFLIPSPSLSLSSQLKNV